VSAFAKNLCRLFDRWTVVLAGAALAVVCGTPVLATSENAGESAMQRLGRILFFDQRLSADGKVSCATCHRPDREFADDRPISVGAYGRVGTRNAPSLIARRVDDPLFWDGRRLTLESQVMDPIVNPFEHGLATTDALLAKVREIAAYKDWYAAAFPESVDRISTANTARSLAVYIDSIPRKATRVERHLGGEQSALTDSEKQGLQIFRGRAQCAQCHLVNGTSAASSDGRFHSVGIGLSQDAPIAPLVLRALQKVEAVGLDHAIFTDSEVSQLGRFLVTKDPRDIGKFKTPGLRRVSATGPYMHDGSIATLEEALDRELYYRSLASGIPIALTPDERADLLAFLLAL
jgi:cytochrome c peroxidase